LKKSFFLFRTLGTLHNAKHQDLQQTGEELQLTKMMKQDAATQEELGSNAGAKKTNDNAIASPPLSGFAVFLSGMCENAKDRHKREGGSEGAGWRVAGTGFVRTVEDTVFPSR
jgi:hypothetical protein